MIRTIRNWVTTFLWLFYFTIVRPSNCFVFKGESYPYLYSYNNFTFLNERAVEVPIIRKILNQNAGRKILEVGNVLSQYYPVEHDVLDKYERVKGVINQDVVDFDPGQKYDLIVRISTLEHVGWDEQPKDPEKVLRAINKLRELLDEQGEMIVTIPLGYNPRIDDLIRKGDIQFTELRCLKKISGKNRWIETKWERVERSTYNNHYPRAEGIVIGKILKNNTTDFIDLETESNRRVYTILGSAPH